jgi:glyoxylase-like metal-dependent hydrolase (beta-lactamase superfamily II)
MSNPDFAVHCITSQKIANIFLLVNKGELTLIDAGNKQELENIRGMVDAAGHSLDELKRIVLTHCHVDHVGSLAALRQATSAQVLAHENEAPFITQESPLPGPRSGILARLLHTFVEPLSRPDPCSVDQRLKHGDVIEGTGLTVIHVPGHSPGSICLYHSETRVLFTGDALINMFGKMRGPIKPFCWDVREAHRSLAKLAELDVQTIYFSHGETIQEAANEKIRSLAETLNKG